MTHREALLYDLIFCLKRSILHEKPTHRSVIWVFSSWSPLSFLYIPGVSLTAAPHQVLKCAVSDLCSYPITVLRTVELDDHGWMDILEAQSCRNLSLADRSASGSLSERLETLLPRLTQEVNGSERNGVRSKRR